MPMRFLFFWSANSLLVFVAVTKFLLLAMAGWFALTVCGTRTLRWIFAE